MFKTFGVCNLALLKSGFAKQYGSLAKQVNDELFQKALSAVARPFNSAFVLLKVDNAEENKVY
jgi:hypothetical protein